MVLDIIGSHLDSGGQVDTIYLDMSKAFDKVDLRILTKKKHSVHGFCGTLLQRLECYLANRTQQVIVPGGTPRHFWCPKRVNPWTQAISH